MERRPARNGARAWIAASPDRGNWGGRGGAASTSLPAAQSSASASISTSASPETSAASTRVFAGWM
jgi:hypothetical protein